jgi:hypothetical protein
MPAPNQGPWINTPNKTDHSTKGYTSKILLNYQVAISAGISILDDNDIIQDLIDNGKNIKGTNILPANYFNNADGRTFRISMYYLKNFDGNDVNLEQQLYDPTNDVVYSFPLVAVGPCDSVGGEQSLVKYECYFSVFYVPGYPAYIAQANGSIIYSTPFGGGASYNAKMLQMSAYNDLGSSVNNEFKIRIKNLNGGTIYPTSLMIEEIS